MQILHVVSGLDPKSGGVSQALQTMIKGLSALSVRSEVVTLDDPQAVYLQQMAFPVYATGPTKSSWQYSPNFRSWMDDHVAKYDLVLVHGLWHYHTYGTYQAWAQLKSKKPRLYVMPHGMLDPWFQRAAGRKLKALRNWLFWRLIENILINKADGLLFTCEMEKELAEITFRPYLPKSKKVVSLGVESPPVFTLAMKKAFIEKCRGLNRPFMLFISRINVKKGVDLLINAYLRLKAEGIELPQLVIAGPGLETAYGQEMQQLADGDPDILFPGMLEGNAKWGGFYSCEAFVLPSHQENFGVAVVEALACSKPVLISNQVNIWKEIALEQAGIIEQDTENGTYALLRRWTTLTSDQQQEMARRAKIAFETHFTVAQASERMLHALNRN
ncbi:glycosyltransferase [Larkinella rosea]|uniref:Glycosyltransferase n=1 Tax=Larkinella rosea TaxID=2025312 RepID=A0A3P1BT21_9BACT|nr:glycosyltransferase [Larkinella rosea]RRB04265.1 glycosyltransferase [Larkinella rosea]